MFLLGGGSDLATVWIKQKQITLYEVLEIIFSIITALLISTIPIFTCTLF